MSEGLESVEMDKKQAGRQSMLPKGSVTEGKKDNGGGNRFPRQNRRRNNGNNNHDQQPATRRAPSQKSSSWVDKRPRQRGVHNTGHPGEMNTSERTEPEFGSVQAWGSKKNNLSHLLNFHFEPRETQSSGRGGSSWKSGKGRGTRPRCPRYNKENFLQANFQFIVQEGRDYEIHTADPDVLVDWDYIEEVRICGSEMTSCPICLYPPTVAKITKCGHIYCWSCILHYLSLGDKQWRKCPICYDAIVEKDLKSVKVVEAQSYTVGDEITLKLMKRVKGSTQAMPVSQWKHQGGNLYSVDDEAAMQFAKILIMTKNQVQALVADEKEILEVQLMEEGEHTLEGSFVKAALDHAKERLSCLRVTTSVSEGIEKEIEKLSLQDQETTSEVEPQAKRNISYKSAFSDNEEEQPIEEESSPEGVVDSSETSERSSSESSVDPGDGEPPVTAPESPVPPTDSESVTEERGAETVSVLAHDGSVKEVPVAAAAEELSMPLGEGACPKRSPNYYYFFQASDGQHIYMHSLNAQCLVREYGSLEKCPETITAKIMELNSVTMNEELRHRLKYLGHLPVTCQFQVAELNLKPPILSVDTLKAFSDKIEWRKKQRQKKSRQEKQFSRKIQEQENKRFGIDPKRVIVHSEAFSIQHEEGVESPIGSPTIHSSSELLATSPRSVTSDEGGQTSMSFAQMLRAGKARPQEMSSRAGGAVDRLRDKDSDGSDNEDRVPVPMFQESFGDAIQRALDKYKGPEADVEVAKQVTPGKKKKKQKTLLFSTSINRAK